MKIMSRLSRKRCVTRRHEAVWNMIHVQERQLINEWRDKRKMDRYRGYRGFFTVPFGMETLSTFGQTVNIMFFIHIASILLAIYIFQKYHISFDLNVALFLSPIVFPLAFSINSDFQRREKVLEDLAAFKSAGMAWYFSMRELKKPAGLDRAWVSNVRSKLISLLFLIGEYLLTSDADRRRIILRAIYDDFAGAHELTEKLRSSKLPANAAIVSRIVHFIHAMGLSVERLCVIKDYRSPRSIRSFNKVFVMVLLIVLAPYLVSVGETSNYSWLPYILGSVLSLMFSTLLGVQDKLDDPFDGLGQDDINVETLDEWAPVLESVHPKTSVNSKSMFFDDNLQTSPEMDDREGPDDVFLQEGEEEVELPEEDSSGIFGDSCDLDYCEDVTIEEEPSSPSTPEVTSPVINSSSRRIPRMRRKKDSSVLLIDGENPIAGEQRKKQSIVDGSFSALSPKGSVQTHLVRGGRASVINNRRRNHPPINPPSASIFNFDYFKREDAKQMIKTLIVQKI